MTRELAAFDWIAHHADQSPDKAALVDEGRDLTLSYAELDEQSRRLAAWLADNGVVKGDRVAFLAGNTTDVFEALFACAKLTAILVPLNWRLAIPEQQFIVDDCRPRVLIYQEQFAVTAAELAAPVKLQLGDDYSAAKAQSDPDPIGPVSATFDDPWAIMYTSGTTGHPKGAIVTHGMIFWNAINIGHAVDLTSKSTNLNVLPTFHTGGLNLYTTPCLHLGARSVNMAEFDPGKVLEWLESGEITHFFGVPAIYQFLAEHPRWEEADLSKVESWACGGAPMPVALLERYSNRGVVIRQGMGLTETSPTVFLTDEAHAVSKVGSVGKPALHTEIRVVDEDGNDVATDEVGELWVRGPNVTPGYWERPEANESSFTDDWLHTGDAARIDADGYVFIVDRWKDMYISGGENVYPAEVEQVLFHHPNVLDVAVIGVADERWGEVGVAVVVPRQVEGFDGDDLLAFCGDKLARYKIPKHVRVIDELPRNAAGKVLKRSLKETLS
ncbi:MAG: long-chain fatty acid--CoA ligase [bacterium]|nr:long-chain fatty acid--CoA ligase [bacterium]MCP4966437.1 long-chain fatty acid--CoA ligase [bacterium]